MPTHVGRCVSPGRRRSISSGGVLAALLARPVIRWEGQSNALALVPTTVNRGGMEQHLGSDLLGWSEASNDWDTLDETGAAVLTGGGKTGGGEVATLVMRRIIEGTTLTQLKLAAMTRTGQSSAFFEPDSPTAAIYIDGSSHASLNNYDLLSSYITASGDEVGLVVRIQGEANSGNTQAAYYASLSEWVDQIHIDHPHAHIILPLTLERDTGQTNFAGVQAAQLQAAATYSFVHTVDCRDMTGNTAYYGGYLNDHYATYLGYEELAERIAAKVLGLAERSNVPAVDDFLNGGGNVTWTNRWRYIHQSTATAVGTWQDDLSNGALTTGTAPDNVRNNASLGNRNTVRFDASNSEAKSGALTAAVTSTTWTFSIVGKLNSTAGQQLFMELVGSGRAGPAATVGSAFGGNATKHGVVIGGSTVAFTNGPSADTDPHVWMFAVDTTEARLYVDGLLVDTQTISPSSIVNPTAYAASLIGVVSFLDADIAEIAIGTGAGQAEDATAAYGYAVAEYGDIFG